MDTRSEPVVSSWDASRRDEVRAISGWSVSPGLGLSTLSWLGAARPGIFERARRFASVDDHVAHALTGSWVTNPSNASGMQLMDVRRLDWSDSLCAMARVDPSRLSTIAPSGALLGRVQAEAAQQTGLAPGLPLVVGGHDQACAALGLGVVAPGAAFLSAGTAWVLTRVVDGTDVATIPTELNLSPHVVEGCWSASQNLGGIGAMLEWWRSQAGASHDDLAAAVDASSPSPDDPFFVLSLADPDRTDWGRFVPGDARSVGARTRAVIEAAAFEVRAALATMSEALGAMTTITIVGGATRNRHLVQAIADATDTPVVTREPASWPAVGAARLAADWLGWPILPTDHAGASSVRPDPSSVARRDDRFATHRRLNAGAPP